ncbi:ornithine cyclodeaminase family protein [Kutzneria kofuensis]|uniref:Ornithine cyclodeaminase n=1 Tax=Kutzneria kofuensis TaxID=103725 RepID=A0A7W9KSB8_9PSEU|nr:ornithine cyclodeaminase family protein [Kutzneria kofuensis]MBB5897841.1 ornithine cyclodeaminase [Kutzneria kofuensis]
MQIKVISGSTVRRLVTLADLAGPMRDALVGFSAGTVYQHPRVTAEPSDGDYVLIMPAGGGGKVGLKVLTMFAASTQHGLPSVQGLVVLVDGTTGQPLALVDGTVITELRTAAVSALATERLARADARTLAVIGAGVQATAHLEALQGVREWDDVRVHSRTPERGQQLVKQAEAWGLPVRWAPSAAEAADGADVICTATSSCSPVIPSDAVGPGTHITAVGAFGATCRELPTEVVVRATLFADSHASVLAEAGDVLIPIGEGRLPADPPLTEIGRVLAGDHPGRTDDDEVTVFKSLGLPVEDVAACTLVYDRALAAGAGQDVDFD